MNGMNGKIGENGQYERRENGGKLKELGGDKGDRKKQESVMMCKACEGSTQDLRG